MKILFITVIVAALAQTVLLQESKLIFVQQVFRHGARYPINPSHLDGSDFVRREHDQGELTSQGKAMHYMLGKMLFKDYWQKLFGDNLSYNQSKFYFKSTDVNRTIESVQSQLLGIFQHINPVNISETDLKHSLPAWNYTLERAPGFVFENSPKFHSLPIHVEKSAMSPWYKADFLRTFSNDTCYKQNDWMEANKQDSFVQEIVNNPNFTDTVSRVNQALGTDNLGFFDIYKFIDNAVCMQYLGMTPNPIFAQNSPVKKHLNAIYAMEGYIKLFYNENQLRATATGYFNETVHNFKKVIKDPSGVQWAFYSAHDTSVMNFISRLGLTSAKCIYQNYLNGTYLNNQSQYCILEYPTYASSLIFEVYQNHDRPHTFKIRYNGHYRRIPICSWAFQCNVNNLYHWYQQWKDQDFIKTCGVKDSDAETLFSLCIIELGIIVVLLVYLAKKYLDRKNIDPKEMTNRLDQEDEAAEPPPPPKAEKMIQESLLSEEPERE